MSTDFGDEMASRDEILKAADDPNAAPVSTSVPPPRVPQATPPPIPALPATSGEMQHATPRVRATTEQALVPSMIVHSPGTGRIQVQVIDLERVLDRSENVGADSWMADDGTNLLASHRWRSCALPRQLSSALQTLCEPHVAAARSAVVRSEAQPASVDTWVGADGGGTVT